jgi:hypothetical protein
VFTGLDRALQKGSIEQNVVLELATLVRQILQNAAKLLQHLYNQPIHVELKVKIR